MPVWNACPQQGDVPISRSSHTIACVNNNETCVVFGGEHVPREPVKNDTYLYDMSTGVWKKIVSSTAPSERLGHVAISTSSTTMFLHGGRSQVNESSTLGDLYSFDVPTGSWHVKQPTGKVPASRNYHASCTTGNDTLYIFGGCGNDGRLADLWRYDVRSGMWDELCPSTMAGRGGAGLVAVSDTELYVVGGFTGAESGDIYRFDIAKNQWEALEIKQPPEDKAHGRSFTPRSVFGKATHASPSCCAHSGHVIIFGGEVDPSDQGHAGAGLFDNTTFCLDTKARAWDVLTGDTAAGPSPRGWAASCGCDQGILVHGGIDATNTRLDDFFILDMHASN